MKHYLVFAILIVPSVLALDAGEIQVSSAGTCHKFTIEITAPLEGCWDAKINAPGRLLHGEQWKHSFFYVEDAFCDGSGLVEADFYDNGDFYSKLKLRQGNNIIEQDFFLDQKCPEELRTDEIFLIVIFVIEIFVFAAVFYRR